MTQLPTSEKVQSQAQPTNRFREILVMTDDQTWIWSLVSEQLLKMNLDHVRLPSTVPIRSSWPRFSKTDYVIIHWESKDRGGGAIVEEILEVDKSFDIRSKVIVLTTNPTHEDVVYFSELGIRKILRLRHRDKDMAAAARDLAAMIKVENLSPDEQLWNSLLNKIDQVKNLSESTPHLAEIESLVMRLAPAEPTARHLDALASLYSLKKLDDHALKTWHQALSCNPNYVRSYHNMMGHYRARNNFKEAYALLQKMHELNKSNISRLIDMGEIQMEIGDSSRAEFYFKSALTRDAYASRALNGLAEIKFHQGHLDESRQLLAKSQLAYKTAHTLNRQGVALVHQGKFQVALAHYTKAQYVLPQQDKGPLLFYNIALCFVKWGKPDQAFEYVQIALIKDPKYEKARKLLTQLERAGHNPKASPPSISVTNALTA
jgi:tetratricopeptide (TPR) repeat protein